MPTDQIAPAPVDVDTLAAMTAADLDATFRSGTAGPIPIGRGKGTAIALRGPAKRAFPALVRRSAWQGKEFAVDPDGRHHLRNLVTPLGARAIRAEVHEGTSWVDDRPCIVLDYAKTSLAARWVRDEIREVAPGVYLGVVFLRRRRLPLMFTLEFATAD
jgi:hypothetical protein